MLGARITASTVAAKSVSPAPSCPYGANRRGRVLITMVDKGKNSGLYLYDLFQRNVGGRRSATEKTQKVVHIDFRQKLVKCFYYERKAINGFNVQRNQSYRHNAVQKCNK